MVRAVQVLPFVVRQDVIWLPPYPDALTHMSATTPSRRPHLCGKWQDSLLRYVPIGLLALAFLVCGGARGALGILALLRCKRTPRVTERSFPIERRLWERPWWS
ncbi:hypothetical protein [Chloroflexus sp. Y-396-1]|uniref:hypothetical protein n=1 Tax=Chloroflexus sp. Y-396-1 TaxID=867845 RepID=UPI0012EC64F5|nr:hypothetical protein [Chloroflexus sp. Y-396-1]